MKELAAKFLCGFAYVWLAQALLGDSQSLTFAGVERKPPDGEPLRPNQEEAQ
jgi:hypothetical protein